MFGKKTWVKRSIIINVLLIIGILVLSLFLIYSTSKDESSDTNAEDGNKYKEEPDQYTIKSERESERAENEKNPYDQQENYDQDELERSKHIAVEFAKSYHSYDADNPRDYVNNVKPYVTDELYEKISEKTRREPLNRSYLAVNDVRVTPVSNKDRYTVKWNVIVKGSAESPDGNISDTEDWYLISLKKTSNRWLVKDVKVNESN